MIKTPKAREKLKVNMEPIQIRTQLWKEEISLLQTIFRDFPDGGVFVEIGTAEGGSSFLIHDLLKEKNALMYTVDCAPSENAAKCLKGTSVRMISGASAKVAEKWEHGKIDFLFIDGDHSFQGIHDDFYAWTPHLDENAKILFHDFDPPERGGIAHFGVEVFLRAQLSSAALTQLDRQYRFLLASLNTEKCKLGLNDFLDTYKNLSGTVRESKWNFLADGEAGALAKLTGGFPSVSSLTACYVVEELLKNSYYKLLDLSTDRNSFITYAEALRILRMGYGAGCFPETCGDAENIKTISDISGLIAREQTKLFLLKQILKTVSGARVP